MWRDVAKAEETERTCEKERVVLFNGDVHDGHWLFGRKHGPGAYPVSGAKYEEMAKAERWSRSRYTKDGKRNLVDNVKSPGAPRSGFPITPE